MNQETISIVNTVIVPVGLIAIMFSLGLSLSRSDFLRVLNQPKAALIGLTGQLIILPLLGVSLALIFNLPAEMAVGLIILSTCPGGVTSNAMVFALRGDVALSVTLTAISSLITVFTTPILVSLAISYFIQEGNAPTLSITDTIMRLAQMTAIPIVLGIALRAKWKTFADNLIVYLRPISMIVLVSVIGFSIYVSFELVLENLLQSGPVAYVLNVTSMVLGYLLAHWSKLNRQQVLTVSIEVGVQNATMATFISLSLLGRWDLAIVPTIYGCIMLINSALLSRLLKLGNVNKSTPSAHRQTSR
jgi:bile acid:Na+ symporter, BASS family